MNVEIGTEAAQFTEKEHINEIFLAVCGLQWKSHICIPFLGIDRPQSQFPHSCVSVSDLYISRICPHIWLQQNRQTDPGDICINLSQIYERRNWETEHYNSVLEIRRERSFIPGKAQMVIRHLHWILIGPSFAV
jgi:hypothetical protein